MRVVELCRARSSHSPHTIFRQNVSFHLQSYGLSLAVKSSAFGMTLTQSFLCVFVHTAPQVPGVGGWWEQGDTRAVTASCSAPQQSKATRVAPHREPLHVLQAQSMICTRVRPWHAMAAIRLGSGPTFSSVSFCVLF